MPILLRLLKYSGIFLLGLVILYAIGRPIHKLIDDFYHGVREPYLQMMSANAVTLRWQSEKAYAGVVRYGLKADQLSQFKTDPEINEEHEVRLTGLKPATKYFYSVGNGTKQDFSGKEFWFKTAPLTKASSDVSTRFWVTGDQGYPNPIQGQVRDAMLDWTKKNPRPGLNHAALDFWVTTGDNAYRSGSNEQFQAGFFEPYKSILRNTPVWPAYGNHDSRRWVFFDIFSFPTEAESGGVASGTEHYYSFDYANIHFVMLDTQDSDHDVDGDMLIWLKNDLQQTKQQWLITVFHHPPYTKGSHNSDDRGDSDGRLITVRENILPLLESAGVDLVLSGHSHMYERSELINCHYGESDSFNPAMIRMKSKKGIYKKKANNISSNSGTIYAVIGSSSKVDMGPLDHPALPYSLQQAGSMIIDVNKNVLKAVFIDNKGESWDQFKIIKGIKQGAETKACN